MVAYERFDAARRAGASDPELLGHLKVAETASRQALDLTPTTQSPAWQLNTTSSAWFTKQRARSTPALTHHKQAIRHGEMAGNRYDAARIRFKVALVLRQTGRLKEALLYAQAALRDYATYGHRPGLRLPAEDHTVMSNPVARTTWSPPANRRASPSSARIVGAVTAPMP
jgi:hypothetical protein